MSGDTAFHSAAVRPDSFAEASSLSVMSPSRAARLEPVVSISACRLAIRASMSSSDRLMLRQRITLRNSLGGLLRGLPPRSSEAPYFSPRVLWRLLAPAQPPPLTAQAVPPAPPPAPRLAAASAV